jgi:hypothetical protein
MAQMSVVILPNDHGRLANFDLEQLTTKFWMISAMSDRDFYYEAQLQGGSPMLCFGSPSTRNRIQMAHNIFFHFFFS